jgi:LmbE family N-acetylglucosaminyl deacetylase
METRTNGRTVLLSCAHPDDESFIIGGILRRYAEEGVRLVLSSATSGQAGSMGDPPLCSREELARVREDELREAARILGIGEVHLLGYQDRQLAEAPVEELRARLVRLIRDCRPEVVITFDPHGVNGHTDHVAISRFTSDAVNAAADPRWLPEAGAPHKVSRLVWTAPLRVYALGSLADPAAEPGIDFLFDIRPWSRYKAEALRAHRTQHKSVNRHFFDCPDLDSRLHFEALRQAWGPPLERRPEDDLFAGL